MLRPFSNTPQHPILGLDLETQIPPRKSQIKGLKDIHGLNVRELKVELEMRGIDHSKYRFNEKREFAELLSSVCAEENENAQNEEKEEKEEKKEKEGNQHREGSVRFEQGRGAPYLPLQPTSGGGSLGLVVPFDIPHCLPPRRFGDREIPWTVDDWNSPSRR